MIFLDSLQHNGEPCRAGSKMVSCIIFEVVLIDICNSSQLRNNTYTSLVFLVLRLSAVNNMCFV